MRIAYFAATRIPSRAANSIHVMKICAAMAALGHRVSLRTTEYDGDEGVYAHYGVPRSFSISAAAIPFLRLQSLAGLRMALAARLQGTDLVWGRNLAGCYYASRLGLPVVFETHDDSSALNDRGRAMLRHLFRSRAVRKVVVISEALADIYRASHPEAAGKLLVAHDGADPVPLRKEWGLGAEPRGFKVGYIGHLYRGRGVELILELSRACPWATFYLLGGNPEDVERWRGESAGLGNVVFLGFLPPSEVEKARSGFDALIAPYQRKVAVSGNAGNTAAWMSPLKIFEYMSSGSPIVASDLPALREILIHGENALLCPPEGAEEWAQALASLRDDAALRERLGGSARALFLQKYTWEARARDVLAAVLG